MVNHSHTFLGIIIAQCIDTLAYYVNFLENFCNKSFCFISDDTEHDVTLVYTFQKTLTECLKLNFPWITKIFYFSDGCAGQYKTKRIYTIYANIVNNLVSKQNGIFLPLLTVSLHAML